MTDLIADSELEVLIYLHRHRQNLISPRALRLNLDRRLNRLRITKTDHPTGLARRKNTTTVLMSERTLTTVPTLRKVAIVETKMVV